MKKYILLLLIAGGLLAGCFNEDDIHVEEQSYKRKYDTTSTDPVWKYVSEYYYKYGKLLITDPDSSDYLFNFQWKNTLWLKMPDQSQEHLLAGIKFFEEMFSNSFTDEFKKEFFPYSIILADSVVFTGGFSSTKWDPKTIYPVETQISFLISEHTLNLSETEKQDLSFSWLMKFLVDYCTDIRGMGLNIDDAFYSTSKEYYGRYKDPDAVLPKEEWYKRGFLAISDSGYYSGWGWSDPYWYTDFPSYPDTDLSLFLKTMCTMDHDELLQIVDEYPKVAIRDNCVKNAFEGIGIDYRNMGYKAKN